MNSATVGPVQIGKKREIGGGVAVTAFKSFTGGKIFEYRLNSGSESPFFSNSFSIHVKGREGTPSALNGEKVNPALLEIVAGHLKLINVAVAQDGKGQGSRNLFLEPKKEAVPVDWASLKLARDEKPISTGLYDPDDHELHG